LTTFLIKQATPKTLLDDERRTTNDEL